LDFNQIIIRPTPVDEMHARQIDRMDSDPGIACRQGCCGAMA